MKTKKWMSMTASAAALLLGSACTHDWGQMDPPAGDQVYPTMQSIAAYAFDAEEELDPLVINLYAYPDGEIPALYEDELAKSPVLNLASGYARFNNPLKNVAVQNAVSYTFWMKQNSDPVLDEEGNPVEDQVMPQDLTSPIMYWENENSSASLSFSANGWLKYDGLDGKWEENNPDAYKTGYLTPDEWHYVALIIRDHGYALYVDGEKKADITSSDLNYSNAVQFAAQAPYMYFNYGADTHTSFYLEDLTVYRNEITAKQISRPKKGNIGGGEGGPTGPDYSKWVLLGNEDNSTGFWSAWGPYINLTGNGTIKYQFVNYTTGNNNWSNWGLVLTTGAERGGAGYAEWLYLRADAYGWGSLYETGEMSHDFNWDNFTTEMNGAIVDMDITRVGAKVTVTAKVTAESGTVYTYVKSVEGVEGDVLGTFLTVEGGHLLINPDATFVGQVYAPGAYTVGTDLNTGFWSVWSNQVRMTAPFSNVGFEFIMHSPGESGQNYHSWGLVVTNGFQSAPDGQRDPDYAEYYYLRADAYGWGSVYAASTMTHGFDWSTFKEDIKDANCRMYFSYSNSELTMACRMTRVDGTRIPEYRFVSPGVSLPLSLIISCEGSWVEMLKVGEFPMVDMTAEPLE